MQKPRIGIIHYSAPPVIGGVEEVIKYHALFFRSHRYPVHVLGGSGRTFYPEVRLTLLPQISALHPLTKKINRDFVQGKRTSQFERRVKFFERKLTAFFQEIDVCFIHNVLTMPFNIAFSVALQNVIPRFPNKRFIAWVHDMIWDDAYQCLRKPLQGVVYVTISSYRKQQLKAFLGIPEEKILVVPNGMYLTKFLKLRKATIALFQEKNLFEQDLVFFYPTRLVPRKNIEFALHILKAINAHKQASLLITAPPDPHNPTYKRYFRSLQTIVKKLKLEEKVIFLSQFSYQGKPLEVNDALIGDLYRLADALLMTSSDEGFGIPLMEAGLARMPVICTNIPPFKELAEGHACFLDLQEDPDHAAQKILRFLEKNTLPQYFRKILHNYRWHSIFHEFLEPLAGKQKKTTKKKKQNVKLNGYHFRNNEKTLFALVIL